MTSKKEKNIQILRKNHIELLEDFRNLSVDPLKSVEMFSGDVVTKYNLYGMHFENIYRIIILILKEYHSDEFMKLKKIRRTTISSYLGRHMSDETKEKLRIINTGKKMPASAIEKTRQAHLGSKRSPETRARISKASKGRECSPETREKLSKANKGRKLSQEIREKMKQSQRKSLQNPTVRENRLRARRAPSTINKMISTKRKNKTFNTSRPEQRVENRLVSLFGMDQVLTQYKSKQYPFLCDFYIPHLQLYIECNFHWTHGGRPFISTSEDLYELEKWQEKAKTSQFYKNAIKTWTERDVVKLNTFKKNKLNHIIFYTEEEAIRYINLLKSQYEHIHDSIC